jgi:hypothetical protein
MHEPRARAEYEYEYEYEQEMGGARAYRRKNLGEARRLVALGVESGAHAPLRVSALGLLDLRSSASAIRGRLGVG